MEIDKLLKNVNKLSPQFGELAVFPGLWIQSYNCAFSEYVSKEVSSGDISAAKDAMIISAGGFLWSLKQHVQHTKDAVEQTQSNRDLSKKKKGSYSIDPIKLYGAAIDIPHWAQRVGAIPSLAAFRDLCCVSNVSAFYDGHNDGGGRERSFFLLALMKHLHPRALKNDHIDKLKTSLSFRTRDILLSNRRTYTSVEEWEQSCLQKFIDVKDSAMFDLNLNKSVSRYFGEYEYLFTGASKTPLEYAEKCTSKIERALIKGASKQERPSPLFVK